MKQIKILFALFLLAGIFTACGDDDVEDFNFAWAGDWNDPNNGKYETYEGKYRPIKDIWQVVEINAADYTGFMAYNFKEDNTLGISYTEPAIGDNPTFESFEKFGINDTQFKHKNVVYRYNFNNSTSLTIWDGTVTYRLVPFVRNSHENIEKNAIKDFIASRDIKVITIYPSTGIFAENQYFYDSESDVYFHVVDSGNGNRVKIAQKVFVRYADAFSLYDSTNIYKNEGVFEDYINFTYGNPTTYVSSSDDTQSNYRFKSKGMTIPLNYVGENAIVKMIVPFDVGSGYQKNKYEPVFIGQVKYLFNKDEDQK